ncbi:glycoside hydrolase family 3 C-terminal domain-containing protein [Stenotrophomonas sp. 24(2023)]|uniref:beta-glucosidase family protein n=1 Tax=Stenotrophomonas sp. 24(2023) TaxID=3068324 RepID=UPI0027E15910|nr:glycoside hydrolase family 3 C-terminal domain-containing protein [Stenotrophomonas sp. 24(2023)]WMJ69576.1 glycoside hydrolase family 3 C-terminal domain-containing protein [Stenotrophomonas sp. 24(2023)]
MKTFTKPLALSLALSAALSAQAGATPAAFTVLTLEQAPDTAALPALGSQLQTLQVDAVSVRQVQRGVGAIDPLQRLADQAGYQYRFIAADDGKGVVQKGQVLLTRLPVEAESGPDQAGLGYLRVNDGRHVVALYADGVGAGNLPQLVSASRLGAPAVLLGSAGAGIATATPHAHVFSDGFQGASSAPLALKGTKASLLSLAYAADKGGEQPWMDAALSADARAALLLKAMTEDEKFQMLHSYFGLGKDGGPLPEGAVGSAGFVPGVPRLGIPSQQSADAGVGVTNPGGIRKGDFATAMPSGPSTAASWNPQVAFAGGATMGREAWQQRFNILLSGSVNLQRDPRNGRNFEYAGEDPLLAGVMVGAVIQGVQSQHVISSMKHFAMNDMETRRNFHDVRIGEQAMHESDLLAFEIALEAGRPGVAMCSYNKINGTYGCENGYLMNQVLKQEWKFPGFVMSDWGGVHSGSKAALAGLDQQSAGEVFDAAVFFDEPLRLAVHGGVVPQSRLDDMVARILRTLFAHGNFDNPPQHQPIDVQAGYAAAQRTVEEGSVLLRNEGNLLPLADSAKRIVIIGGHADKGVIGGGGSSMVGVTAKGTNAVPGVMPTTWPGPVIFHPSSPLESLRAARPDATITYVDGSNATAAAKAAAQADVAIVFATQWAAESVDLPDMQLPDNQDALISAVARANPKTVVVLETNGPVRTPWLAQVPALLQAWYPGIRGGEGIAALLTGQANPSGRLPVTWVVDESQLPRPHIDGLGFTPAKPFGDVFNFDIEGANVGYKWMAAKGLTPTFAFGHGLSYTSFAYENLTVSVDGARVVASVDIRNTGARAGADVAQLYLKLPAGNTTPVRLIGFDKVSLQPGEQRRIRIEAEPKTLAHYDAQARQWKIAAGTYQVQLGRTAAEPLQRVDVQLAEQVLR